MDEFEDCDHLVFRSRKRWGVQYVGEARAGDAWPLVLARTEARAFKNAYEAARALRAARECHGPKGLWVVVAEESGRRNLVVREGD